MTERGVAVDHSTIYRWVQHFAPEMEKRLRGQWRRPKSRHHMLVRKRDVALSAVNAGTFRLDMERTTRHHDKPKVDINCKARNLLATTKLTGLDH